MVEEVEITLPNRTRRESSVSEWARWNEQVELGSEAWRDILLTP